MASLTQCDKCQAVYPTSAFTATLHVTGGKRSYYDLCQDCMKGFEQWVKSQ